ncbi:MAG: shikimate dehydrogenase [Candidatus Omnitrophota bacterium]|nr:shikimate dehydrogenase [Candidatus Omnitrophota bacterium]
MNRFGFIIHPIDMATFYDYFGFWGKIARILPQRIAKNISEKLPPRKLTSIDRIRSASNIVIGADVAAVPLLPIQIAYLGEEKVLNLIEKGIQFCEKKGAKIVGLGAFTSVVGNEGEVLSRRVSVPLTSGNTFTAALALEGIYKAASFMGLSLKDATVAVIGATGDIGSICTMILAKKVKSLNMAARNEKKLEDFANSITSAGGARAQVFKYTKDAVKDADIVLTATSALTTIIDPMNLKPGAIVCDVAIPANIAKEVAYLRNDVFVFEGGLAKFPYPEDFVNKTTAKLLPNQSVYGCISETAMLTFENRFESFSLGRGNITEGKIEEIKRLASKHGVTLADYFCGYKFYSNEDIDNIRKNAERNREKAYAA